MDNNKVQASNLVRNLIVHNMVQDLAAWCHSPEKDDEEAAAGVGELTITLLRCFVLVIINQLWAALTLNRETDLPKVDFSCLRGVLIRAKRAIRSEWRTLRKSTESTVQNYISMVQLSLTFSHAVTN